jgi:AraC family transcriptional regulator
MHADVQRLHSSPFASVIDFRCKELSTNPSEPEYQSTFGISFIRQGAFEYRLGRHVSVVHSGLLLLENPHTERCISHYYGLRDRCTCIEFNRAAFGNSEPPILQSFPALVVNITPRLEVLHSLILAAGQRVFPNLQLRLDALVVEVLKEVLSLFGPAKAKPPTAMVNRKWREFYLEKIDRAKNLMRSRFREELSLLEISRAAGISLFHFSRLFKTFTGFSPHQYLAHLRLQHAQILLRNTSLGVTEVCFESGFQSLEYFISAFARHFGASPGKFRRSLRDESLVL